MTDKIKTSIENQNDMLLRFQDERSQLLAAIRKHKDKFLDEPLQGELELWSILEQIK